MKVQVGINGFGRIGRQVLKSFIDNYSDELEVVAINDLFDTKTNAHLFKYDSTYGKFDGSVDVVGNDLVINGKTIKVFAEKDPGALPWKDLGVDIVVEKAIPAGAGFGRREVGFRRVGCSHDRRPSSPKGSVALLTRSSKSQPNGV